MGQIGKEAQNRELEKVSQVRQGPARSHLALSAHQKGLNQAIADNPKLQSIAQLQEVASNSPRLQSQIPAQLFANEQVEQSVGDQRTIQRAQEDPAPPNRTGLPDRLKSSIESMSGTSLDHVRVHRNSSAPAQLNAHAYAQGSQIHIAPGQDHHLPHEAWHVVQQAQGRVKPTMRGAGGKQINDDPALEREADTMGDKAKSYQLSAKPEGLPQAAAKGGADEASSAPYQLVKFYHGTDYEAAKKLEQSQTKIKAEGKGEFGGGFYMTHDMHQAAHIADYYCGQERRGKAWAVIEFDVDDAAIETLKEEQKYIPDEEVKDFYKGKDEREVESEHDWTVGLIKDNHTPYIQHLFARGAFRILNNSDLTVRKIVLVGNVGTDKYKYREQVEDYDHYDDAIFDELIKRADPEEVASEEEEDEEDYDLEHLEGRVRDAEQKGAAKLTKAVLKELDEAENAGADDSVLAKLRARLEAL